MNLNRFEKDMELVDMCHKQANKLINNHSENELPLKTWSLRCDYYLEAADRILKEWGEKFQKDGVLIKGR